MWQPSRLRVNGLARYPFRRRRHAYPSDGQHWILWTRKSLTLYVNWLIHREFPVHLYQVFHDESDLDVEMFDEVTDEAHDEEYDGITQAG